MAIRAAILVYSLSVASSGAFAQDVREELYKTANAAARVGALYPICKDIFIVDRDKTMDVASEFAAQGISKYGKSALNAAVTSSMLKFQNESQKLGARKWCENQISHFHRLGIKDLISSF